MKNENKNQPKGWMANSLSANSERKFFYNEIQLSGRCTSKTILLEMLLSMPAIYVCFRICYRNENVTWRERKGKFANFYKFIFITKLNYQIATFLYDSMLLFLIILYLPFVLLCSLIFSMKYTIVSICESLCSNY